MSKFNIITVAEDNYQSDRLTAKCESDRPNRQVVKISITAERTLVVEAYCPNNRSMAQQITAFDIDVESLLQFVQDANTFVREEAMIKKLIGK